MAKIFADTLAPRVLSPGDLEVKLGRGTEMEVPSSLKIRTALESY
jgi:hypothetical protein